MKAITINKHRLWVIGLLVLSSSLMAQFSHTNNQPMDASPSVTMRSVNNTGYMTSGSVYSSSVSVVGANNPITPPAGSGPRRSGFNDITTDQDTENNFDNPQFSPIGDALLPLLLMALIFAGITYLRRRKATNE